MQPTSAPRDFTQFVTEVTLGSDSSSVRRKIEGKKRRAASVSSLLLACTLPQVLRQIRLLVERRRRATASSNCCTRRLNANHRVFEGAEAADTGLVQSDRASGSSVLHQRRTTRTRGEEVVAALGAAAQHAVNQAGRGRARSARSRSAEVGQRSGKADRRIVR